MKGVDMQEIKILIRFIKENKAPLIGVAAGFIAGYLYWYHIACYQAIYPFFAECWVNCTFGALAGGFLVCLVREYLTQEP